MNFILSNILLELAGNLAYDLFAAGARRLRHEGLTDVERKALLRAYEGAFKAMLEKSAAKLPADTQMHVAGVLRSFLSNVRLSDYLLDLALTKYASIKQDVPTGELRSRFEDVGCDPDTLPLDFDEAIESFLLGLADSLQQEEVHLHRIVSLTLMRAMPSLVQQHREEASGEYRTYAIQDYLLSLRSYCNRLPYSTLPGKPLPSLLDVHVEQTAEWKRESDNGYRIQESADKRYENRSESLEQILEQDRHILLEGGPGQGKSSSLNRLALSLIDRCLQHNRQSLVPIVVSARGLATRQCTLSEGLHAQVTEQLGLRLRNSIPSDLFAHPPFPESTWLLMIDGLDEIVALKDRQQLVEVIEEHAKREPSFYRFVITTRPISELHLLFNSAFKKFVLQEFDPAQRASFAQHWFQNRPNFKAASAELFLSQVEKSHIVDLARVPLLLTISAVLFEQKPNAPLPSRKAALYETFVRALLEDEESERETRKTFCDEWQKRYGHGGGECAEKLFLSRRELLEHVALDRQRSGSKSFAEATKEFIKHSGCLQHPVDEGWLCGQVEILLQRTGLVVTHGTDTTFIHHTFQEFLAASALARRHKTHGTQEWDIVKECLSPDLQDTLMFLLGIWNEAGHNVTEIVHRIWTSPKFMLAAAAIADGVKVDSEVENGVVASVITHTLRLKEDRSHYSERKYPSLDLLSKLCRREDVKRVLLSLARKHPLPHGLSAKAIDALEQHGQLEDVLSLGLDNNVSGFIRLHCAWVLQKDGHIKSAESILLALADDVNVNVPQLHLYVEDRIPYLAARQLGDIGRYDEAGRILLAVARRTKCEVTREEAIKALYAFDRCDELISLARDPEMGANAKVNIAFELARAAHILIELGRVPEAERILLEILANGQAQVWCRLDALKSLTRIEFAESTFSTLSELMLNTNEDALLRTEIASLLIGSKKTADGYSTLMIIGLDVDEDARVRYVAAKKLDEVGYCSESAKAMLSLVKDPLRISDSFRYFLCLPKPIDEIRSVKNSIDLRLRAIDVLKRLKRPIDLLDVVRDEKVEAAVRVGAADAAAELGDSNEIPPVLLQIACDSTVSADVHSESISLLQRLGRTQELLTIATCHKTGLTNRVLAARAAGTLGQLEPAKQFLFDITQSEEGMEIRKFAADCLYELTAEEEVALICQHLAKEEIDPLLRLARNPNALKSVRRMAVDRIARLDHQHLWSLAEDENLNPDLRLDAVELLNMRGFPVDPIPYLFAVAANDTDEDRHGFRNSYNALEDLKQICREAATTSVIPPGYAELTKLASNTDLRGWTRFRAAEALLSLGYREVAAGFLHSLTCESTQEIERRASAIELLGKSGCLSELLSLSTAETIDHELRIKSIGYLRQNAKQADLDGLKQIELVLTRLARNDVEGRIRAAAHDSLLHVHKYIRKKDRLQRVATGPSESITRVAQK